MVGRGLLAPSAYIFTLSLVPSPAATTAGFLRTPGEEYTYPLGLRLPHVVLHNQGSGETEKTPPETEQAAGLPGSMIGFKIGETRQPPQVLNGYFASLQVFVAIGARMKRAFF